MLLINSQKHSTIPTRKSTNHMKQKVEIAYIYFCKSRKLIKKIGKQNKGSEIRVLLF